METLSDIVARRLAQAAQAGRSIRPRDFAQVVRGDLSLAGEPGIISTERVREALEHAFASGGLPGYAAVLVDAVPGEYCYMPLGASYARMLRVAQAPRDSKPLEDGDAFDVFRGVAL